MERKRVLLWLALGAAVCAAVRVGFARCMPSEIPNYYCASAVFVKEMPELKLGGPDTFGSRRCQGSLSVAGKSITAVFVEDEELPCPAPGERVVGHMGLLCHDGLQPWTKAEYVFSREPAFCSKSHEEALREAQGLAAKIQPGMAFEQVWRGVLLDYPVLEKAQWFVYPDIGLRVPFTLSVVSGPVEITKVEMLRPWQTRSISPLPKLPDPPVLSAAPALSAPLLLPTSTTLPAPPAP